MRFMRKRNASRLWICKVVMFGCQEARRSGVLKHCGIIPKFLDDISWRSWQELIGEWDSDANVRGASVVSKKEGLNQVSSSIFDASFSSFCLERTGYSLIFHVAQQNPGASTVIHSTVWLRVKFSWASKFFSSKSGFRPTVQPSQPQSHSASVVSLTTMHC